MGERNKWGSVPFVGLFTKGKFNNRQGNIQAVSCLGALVVIGSFLYIGAFTSLGWNPGKYKSNYLANKERTESYSKYKREVMDFVNVDKKEEVTRREIYKRDSLMGILDKDTIYVPTFEDWQRGYEKISKNKE